MISRRNLVKLGGLAGAAAILPAERIVSALGAKPAQASPAVELFAQKLRIPSVLERTYRKWGVDHYEVSMREGLAQILPGAKTPIWGYNGQFPGPTFKVDRYRPIKVKQTNKLDKDLAVHLHGGNVPSSSDGLPGDEIAPGDSRTYFYPNLQQAATLWYHDHKHGLESFNSYMGLSGYYLLDDGTEKWLDLPSGKYDVPLLIQDRFFNNDNTFRLPVPGEFAGDVTLVNGTAHPRFEVERRPYRFRVLNGSSMDGLVDLSLDNGASIHVIGNDGGLLERPVPVQHLPVAPSERYDVIIDFSKYAVGTKIVLKNAINFFGNRAEVMRFDVTKKAQGHVDPIPKKLVHLHRLDPKRASKHRTFELSTNFEAGQMLINGKTFDPTRVDVKPKLGATEIWTVRNAESPEIPIPHVFHTHLVRFQILDRDGKPPAPHEAGWKDSVTVEAGTSVRLIMKFGDFTGRFLYHCHLLGHADAGMMAQMEVVR